MSASFGFTEYAASKGSQAKKIKYLGHRPKGVSKPKIVASGRDIASRSKQVKPQRSTRILTDYKLSEKVSSTPDLEKEILREDEARKRKRLRNVRKKLLKTSLFSLNGVDDEEGDEGDDAIVEGLDAKSRNAKELKLLQLLGAGEDQDAEATTEASSDEELDEEATKKRFESGTDRKRKSEAGDERKSKRSKLAELISKSKEARAEASRAKHVQLNLLHLLDEDYDAIKDELQLKPTRAEIIANPVLAIEDKKNEGRIFDYRSQQQIQIEEDFDRLLASMKTAARGVASDRLKTPAEIAQEKARQLRKIEEERIAKIKAMETVANESDDESEEDESESSNSESVSDDEQPSVDDSHQTRKKNSQRKIHKTSTT